ncbi:MAG: SIS domain-containing protein [Planctomycetes bacterium]|nr:SIS domain-containing protein [Planctomycetota bacterium]
MSNYKDLAKVVLKEHEQVLMAVDENEVEKLLDAIAEAKCIQVFGMGRMKCAVRAFVMRLMHMGFDAHVVYDTTCPNIGPGDLLIVNAACTTVGYTVMQFANKLGAKIVAITANPNSKAAKLCDFTVNLKGQVHGGRDYEIPSIQPMAALFEQTIFVFEDIIIQLLMKKLNITSEQMAKRHTNLDGYMDFNVEDE